MSGFKDMMNQMKSDVKENAFAAVQGHYYISDSNGGSYVVVVDGMTIEDKTVAYGMAMYGMDKELYAENKPCWFCIGKAPAAVGVGGRDYDAVTTTDDAIDTVINGAMKTGLKAQGMTIREFEKMSKSDVDLFEKFIIKDDFEEEDDTDDFDDDEDF